MRIQHARITLELHELARRDGPALLLLHALYGSSADWGDAAAKWPGTVYALDFCGHGESDWIKGGGYCPELLVADADAALTHISAAAKPAAVAGTGLGAYVALLIAGARPQVVRAALLLPGAGLDGSGALPDHVLDGTGAFPDHERAFQTVADQPVPGRYDPLAHVLDLTVRPVEYAAAFAQTVRHLLLAENGTPRPPWWAAARDSPNAEVVTTDRRAALEHLARVPR